MTGYSDDWFSGYRAGGFNAGIEREAMTQSANFSDPESVERICDLALRLAVPKVSPRLGKTPENWRRSNDGQ